MGPCCLAIRFRVTASPAKSGFVERPNGFVEARRRGVHSRVRQLLPAPGCAHSAKRPFFTSATQCRAVAGLRATAIRLSSRAGGREELGARRRAPKGGIFTLSEMAFAVCAYASRGLVRWLSVFRAFA